MQCRLEVAAELQQRWRRTNRRRKSAFHSRAAVTGKARSPSVQIKRAGGNNNNSVKLGYILRFIVVRLLLILTPFNGTEMAFYVLMCRKETAHSLTVKLGQLVHNGDLRGGGGLDVRGEANVRRPRRPSIRSVLYLRRGSRRGRDGAGDERRPAVMGTFDPWSTTTTFHPRRHDRLSWSVSGSVGGNRYTPLSLSLSLSAHTRACSPARRAGRDARAL